MSDWKERGIKRRDFRSGKFEPEVPKHKKSKKNNKKPWKIVVVGYNMFGRKDWVLGRYANEAGAKEALRQHKANYWGKYNLRIEKDE